ncbi:hypothetical protein EIN_428700 [Entamoeba invadens IP1]|uniref:PX domain-containing protein n=1 Tax=Entamoeba invadens IP1 TaxID=370355 RepID=A0A0A1UGT7_ENTIV|nr:hypothetical protein EIN_428700 [Entamoeba invadens IP1]ELP95144.1 hypothetical protein EIN_428700 [Entamoeba invadens IP1]|eukprot:XP_004261915.1 hypothetical protein EIN_428700 [Entamoeba invadens IP1]
MQRLNIGQTRTPVPFDRSTSQGGKTVTPSASPDNATPERVSCDCRRQSQIALVILTISFLKCEQQIDISSVLSPTVVGIYFFEVQLENTSMVIEKRYSQFYFLDNYLHLKLPKKVMPTLPPKEILHSGSHPDVIHRRSKELSKYLETIVKIPGVLKDTVVVEWFMQPPDKHIVGFSKQRKAGYLSIEGSFFKNWKRRYAVLAKNVIALFKTAKDLLVYEDPIEVFCIRNCTIAPVLDKGPNVMTLSRNNMTLCSLYVENDDDFLSWLSAIQTDINVAKGRSTPLCTRMKVIPPNAKKKTSTTLAIASFSALSVNDSPRKKTGKRLSRMFDTDVCSSYESVINALYERFRNEMNTIYPVYLEDRKEMKEEHCKFFEEIRGLQLSDFLEGNKLEDTFQKLLVVSKLYTNLGGVQKITWLFINIHKMYRMYCGCGFDALEQFQEFRATNSTQSIDSSFVIYSNKYINKYRN